LIRLGIDVSFAATVAVNDFSADSAFDEIFAGGGSDSCAARGRHAKQKNAATFLKMFKMAIGFVINVDRSERFTGYMLSDLREYIPGLGQPLQNPEIPCTHPRIADRLQPNSTSLKLAARVSLSLRIRRSGLKNPSALGH
jgi:hypothetical protein